MRPREIQTRIRAGETVEHLAASAGIPEQRVERYAYPVLLERSRNAELAQHAHPVREDGPDVQTLGEVVAHAFGVRGQDYSRATWDSWRGDDGKWIVGLHWKAGRSDNRAHWVFSPGAHGGTVTAVDEPAEDLLNPHANRTPRTLRAVTREGAQDDARHENTRQESTRHENTAEQPTLDSAADAGTDSLSGTLDADAERGTNVIEAPIPEPADDDTTEFPAVPAEGGAARDNGERRAKGKKTHPVVPSWEDVLLGVRTQRG
jgi:hypothetical protein